MASESQASKNVLSALIAYLICTVSVIAQGGSHHQELTTEDTCGNSDYLTVKGRLMENYDSAEELYRLPHLANSSLIQRFNRTWQSFYIHDSHQECHSLRTRANNQGGMTCPGRYELNRDENRVPCVMREFKCLCSHCLIPHSLQPRQPNCEPIYHYVPVMRRTTRLVDEGDTWSYFLEPLAVGCTCVPRRNIFPIAR